jgi:hypothetical protein
MIQIFDPSFLGKRANEVEQLSDEGCSRQW